MIDLKLETLISSILSGFDQEGVVGGQVRSEFLKYEIKKIIKEVLQANFAVC